MPMVSRNVGLAWHIPLAPLAALVLFCCAAARARHELNRTCSALAATSRNIPIINT